MESQTTEQQGSGTSPRDTVLLIAALLLLAGGLWAFYQFADQFNVLVRTLMVLGGIGGALALAYQTQMGKLTWAAIGGARTEMRKVVWPTRQESLQATLMIAVIVVIFAIILGIIDWLLNSGVMALTGRGN